jgi:hypothetical protein
MVDLINKALEIAEEYPVFPCDVKKRPVCEGGFKAATQDPDEIERLFSVPNAALIGMPTGQISGVSVIDIDVRDAKGGKDWREENAEVLGSTRVAETQSGGWHYYYRHSDGIRNRAGISGCVDIRGDGGYVIHPESVGYRWLNDEDFAEFPIAVADFTAAQHTDLGSHQTDIFGSIVDGREKYMAEMVMASLGDYYRQTHTYPTVKWMVENVYPTYEAKVKSRSGDLEKDGRGLTEFKKKCESTIRKAHNGGFPDLGIAPPKKLNGALQAVYEPHKARERKIVLKSLSELRQTPPPTYQVAPYVIDKSFAVLFGAPASYKSFLALDWALSIAHGVDWNERPVMQGTVVYLALEGQTGLATRSEAWHRERGLKETDAPFYAVTTPISLADEAGDLELLMDGIDDGLAGEMPSMVVVDTLARSFVGKDENSSTDMGVFVRNMDLLIERYDCTVLVVHHSGKQAERGMRGSSSLRGAVSSEFELIKEVGTQTVALHVRKQKDVEEAEQQWLTAREVSWVQSAFGEERTSLILEPVDQPDKPRKFSTDQVFALNLLEQMIADGGEWVENNDGSGIPYDAWRDRINELRRDKDGNPKPYSKSGWYHFVDRLLTLGVINKNNGLVSLTSTTSTEHQHQTSTVMSS